MPSKKTACQGDEGKAAGYSPGRRLCYVRNSVVFRTFPPPWRANSRTCDYCDAPPALRPTPYNLGHRTAGPPLSSGDPKLLTRRKIVEPAKLIHSARRRRGE